MMMSARSGFMPGTLRRSSVESEQSRRITSRSCSRVSMSSFRQGRLRKSRAAISASVTMVPDEPMAMSNLCCRSFWTARTLMLRT